ncbi:hypothetical protein E4T56_gene5465 [Termitomyces sp. T112]|nr:hypothetical protein E4T56_gene5465 [Termitomyces sp. T112]
MPKAESIWSVLPRPGLAAVIASCSQMLALHSSSEELDVRFCIYWAANPDIDTTFALAPMAPIGIPPNLLVTVEFRHNNRDCPDVKMIICSIELLLLHTRISLLYHVCGGLRR